MFTRNRGLFLIAVLTLIGLAFFVRRGHAQKDVDSKAAPAESRKVALKNPVIGEAVKVASTAAARDLEGVDAFDSEIARRPREVNPLNKAILRTARADMPPQRDGALQ